MTTPPQLSASFRERLDAFARELPGVEDGSVEALHRARVGSRRLRELLPLLTLDRETTQRLKRRLRDVTRVLGEVRELDVLTLLIEELHGSDRYRKAGLEPLQAAVARARQDARDRLAQKRSASKLRRLTARLERAHDIAAVGEKRDVRHRAGRPKRGWLWALEARAVQRAARVRSTIHLVGTIYAPDRLHDVRIALKKLRYVIELLQEGGRDGLTRDLHALKTAQDLLGRLHDFEVLLAWGRATQGLVSPAEGDTWRELGLLLLGLEDDCRRMHARYMQDRAALIAVADRLRTTSAPPSGRRGQRASIRSSPRPARTAGGNHR